MKYLIFLLKYFNVANRITRFQPLRTVTQFLHYFNRESVTTLLESRDQGGKQGPMSGRDSGHWANLVIFPINCLKNLSWCQRCPVCVWPGCSRLMDRWTNGGLDEQLSKENILIWHKICGGEREREISTWSKVQLLSFNFFISGFIDQDQRRAGRWEALK